MRLPVSSLAAETKVTSEICFKYSVFAESWMCLSPRLTCHIKSWRRSVPPAHHTGPFWQQAETGSCLLPTRTVGYSLRPLSPCTGKEKHKRGKSGYTQISLTISRLYLSPNYWNTRHKGKKKPTKETPPPQNRSTCSVNASLQLTVIWDWIIFQYSFRGRKTKKKPNNNNKKQPLHSWMQTLVNWSKN